jgi:hypothetical protein
MVPRTAYINEDDIQDIDGQGYAHAQKIGQSSEDSAARMGLELQSTQYDQPEKAESEHSL